MQISIVVFPTISNYFTFQFCNTKLQRFHLQQLPLNFLEVYNICDKNFLHFYPHTSQQKYIYICMWHAFKNTVERPTQDEFGEMTHGCMLFMYPKSSDVANTLWHDIFTLCCHCHFTTLKLYQRLVLVAAAAVFRNNTQVQSAKDNKDVSLSSSAANMFFLLPLECTQLNMYICVGLESLYLVSRRGRVRYALWTEVRNWFKCLRNWQQNGFFNFIFNVYIWVAVHFKAVPRYWQQHHQQQQ